MPRELLRVYLVTRQKKQKRQTEIGESPTESVIWMNPAMYGPRRAPATRRNTVSGISLPGMSLATMGQMSATSAMTAS